jgi:Domain of unknown function (DUF4920)
MRTLLMALVVVVGCNTQEGQKPSPPAVSTASYGAPIGAGATVALTDVVKAPASFRGQSIITTGTVSRVCQERGCWLALKDGSGDAVVRMHGHSFFVPTTSAGKHARVRGQVMLMKDGRECDEMEAENAQVELDATGVELN